MTVTVSNSGAKTALICVSELELKNLSKDDFVRLVTERAMNASLLLVEQYEELHQSEYEKWVISVCSNSNEKAYCLDMGFWKAIQLLEAENSMMLLSNPPQNEHYKAIKVLRDFIRGK